MAETGTAGQGRPSGATRRQSRRRRQRALTTVVLVVAVSGWTYWSGTPSYALGQASAAARAGDLQAFEKRVDIESLSEAVIDDLMDGVMKQATAESTGDDPFAALGVGIGLQMLKEIRAPAMDLLADRIRSVVSGSSSSDEKNEGGLLSELAEPVAVVAARAEVEGLEGVDRNGNQATAHLGIRHTVRCGVCCRSGGADRAAYRGGFNAVGLP